MGHKGVYQMPISSQMSNLGKIWWKKSKFPVINYKIPNLPKIFQCHSICRCLPKCQIHQICHGHRAIQNISKSYSPYSPIFLDHSQEFLSTFIFVWHHFLGKYQISVSNIHKCFKFVYKHDWKFYAIIFLIVLKTWHLDFAFISLWAAPLWMIARFQTQLTAIRTCMADWQQVTKMLISKPRIFFSFLWDCLTCNHIQENEVSTICF